MTDIYFAKTGRRVDTSFLPIFRVLRKEPKLIEFYKNAKRGMEIRTIEIDEGDGTISFTGVEL